MAVRMRLKRMGRRNRPFYRIGVADARAPRDGKLIEELGTYDPLVEGEGRVSLKKERVDYWLSVGARPTKTVASILRKQGFRIPRR